MGKVQDMNEPVMPAERVERALVLVSGGADSATLLQWVARTLGVRDLVALSFAYGQKHSRELEMARRQVAAIEGVRHEIIDISFFGRLVEAGTALAGKGAEVPDLDALSAEERRQPPTYVPHRNLLFLSLAAAAAEGMALQDIFYGAQAQDEYGYWDCSPTFVERLNQVLALNRKSAVRVHAPFVGLSKADVVKIGLALGVNYAHTWTCYRGAETPCGTCPSCVERALAFRRAGRTDPLLAPDRSATPTGGVAI